MKVERAKAGSRTCNGTAKDGVFKGDVRASRGSWDGMRPGVPVVQAANKPVEQHTSSAISPRSPGSDASSEFVVFPDATTIRHAHGSALES